MKNRRDVDDIIRNIGLVSNDEIITLLATVRDEVKHRWPVCTQISKHKFTEVTVLRRIASKAFENPECTGKASCPHCMLGELVDASLILGLLDTIEEMADEVCWLRNHLELPCDGPGGIIAIFALYGVYRFVLIWIEAWDNYKRAQGKK